MSVCVAAVIAIALIIFLVQNTRSVEISFLWMTTHTSLALALLIAAVGAVLLTLVLGTARITQLRRYARARIATPPEYAPDIRQPPTGNHLPEQHADPRS